MRRKHLSQRRAARRPRDALALLRTDHERIVGLFERFTMRPAEADGARLLEGACHALEVHSQIEQELFYPAVRLELATSEWLQESEVEHRTLDFLLEELRAIPTWEPRARTTAKVLAQFLRQHLDNEERRIFAHVRGGTVDLVGLGELMRHRGEDIAEQKNGMGRQPSAVGRRDGAGRYSGLAPF
jgi:hypothetical protein